MLLSTCVVISLGQPLVSWCIIETQDSDIYEFSGIVYRYFTQVLLNLL